MHQLFTLSMLVLAVVFCASSEPHAQGAFRIGQPTTLGHQSALDFRFIDIDDDGDLDIVSFQPRADCLDRDVRVFKNGLSSGSGWQQLFGAEFLAAEYLGPNLIEPYVAKPDCAPGDDFGSLPCQTAPAVPPPGNPMDPDQPIHSIFDGIYDMYFADVNGDGAEDWIAARLQARDLLFLRDPVSKKFTSVLDLHLNNASDCPGVGERYSTGLGIGDIDQDGDTDIVVCYRDSAPRFFSNEFETTPAGIPGFVEAQSLEYPPLGGSGTDGPPPGNRDLSLKDLDMDGDLDLVLSRMWHFSPTGGCTDPLIRHTLVYENVGYLDENNDGIADPNTPFRFWYDVNPGFDCVDGDDSPGGIGSPTLTITVTDVNGDGYQDLLHPVLASEQSQCNSSQAPGQCLPLDLRTRIYLNDGTGHFGGASHRPNAWVGSCSQNYPSSWFYGADFDLDGDPDFVNCHNLPSGVPDRLFTNDGLDANGVPILTSAQFVNAYPGLTDDNTRYVRFADLDQDGDQDYVESNYAECAYPRIFFNRSADGRPVKQFPW